jgi:UDP-N-acetylglucosamine diphosphorylase / glucose-1-phosphate thymidylyltransferase / UDP-N-acetylgalactosamine diphosphorylase / glucosamine-1-phosphate N-acetyltransferase / galactosamine-1-phosphate N-acetyltransferase
MLAPSDFFDLENLSEPISGLLRNVNVVWDALNQLGDYLQTLFPAKAAILGHVEHGAYLVKSESIYLGPGAYIEAGAYVEGPAYIGAKCQVRHGAYIRGNVIAGDSCVLGHTSEFKNCILLPGSSAPHFAYVGDSILGNRVNLGAGTKLSNLGVLSHKEKATGRRPTIKIRIPELSDEQIDTGLAKLGAILGDNVQTGCNVVTNPGSLVGKGTIIYANVSLPKGYWAGGQIIKLRQVIECVSKLNGNL